MASPAFAAPLEQAFRRDGYTLQRGQTAAVDFELGRQGRRMLVSALRWKSARTGQDALRVLQAAREPAGAPDALYIGLGEVSATTPARSLPGTVPRSGKHPNCRGHCADCRSTMRPVVERQASCSRPAPRRAAATYCGCLERLMTRYTAVTSTTLC